MDADNIQHLVDFIKNNPTYTSGQLADVALRTGYTQDEFREAMRVIDTPHIDEKAIDPTSANVDEVVKEESNGQTPPADIISQSPARKTIPPSSRALFSTITYIEVVLISIALFAVMFGGLYLYTHGLPPFVRTLLGSG